MEPTPLNYASPPPAEEGKKRKPMLAWWGVIPVLLLAAAEAAFIWPLARGSALFVIIYTVAATIGGALAAFLIAWISYRISRRSQFVARIVFTAVLLVLSIPMVLTSLALRYAGGSRSATPTSATMPAPLSTMVPVRAFPTAGIAVDTPAGWQQLPLEQAGVITRWIGPGSTPESIQQMILIRVAKPRFGTGETAVGLAAQWGGRVVDAHVNLDGETAVLTQAEPLKPELQTVAGLVVTHDGNLYMVDGAATPGHPIDGAIETIRKSWKWIPIDPPSKHLEFRKEPVIVLGGRISINYPAAMLSFDDGKPDQLFGISLNNVKLEAHDFEAVVQIAPLADGVTFGQAQDLLAADFQSKFSLAEPFVWHSVGSSGQRAITQPVRVLKGAQERTHWVAWGLISFDRTHVVMINFIIYPEDPNERAIYEATAEKIIASVVPRPASGPEQPAK
ncbi:MAG TPA: hypothetical protein VN541_19275 [Tepidisphaeraceae bacterium]|nr:hypothetical protein [Tepidisphaeraceae bacterium]